MGNIMVRQRKGRSGAFQGEAIGLLIQIVALQGRADIELRPTQSRPRAGHGGPKIKVQVSEVFAALDSASLPPKCSASRKWSLWEFLP